MSGRIVDILQKWFAYHPHQYAAFQILTVPVVYVTGAVMGVMETHEEVRDYLKDWPNRAYELSERWRKWRKEQDQ